MIADMAHMAQFVFDYYKTKVDNLMKQHGVCLHLIHTCIVLLRLDSLHFVGTGKANKYIQNKINKYNTPVEFQMIFASFFLLFTTIVWYINFTSSVN